MATVNRRRNREKESKQVCTIVGPCPSSVHNRHIHTFYPKMPPPHMPSTYDSAFPMCQAMYTSIVKDAQAKALAEKQYVLAVVA